MLILYLVLFKVFYMHQLILYLQLLCVAGGVIVICTWGN